MKALICHRYGDPSGLTVEDIASPPLESRQIRIAMKACGVNFADSLMIAGRYQDPPPLPFTPGMEAAGEVLEVGTEVTDFKVGDRVITLSRFGGYAEEVVAPDHWVLPLPESVDYVSAAALPIAYGTAHLALGPRGRLAPGETLVVHGAGGSAGLAAVEIGKLMGAVVIATAGSTEKLAAAQAQGADHLINYETEDMKARIKEITAGRGADVFYDPVGGKAFEASLKSIAFEGRILLIGFASGNIPQIPANHLLVKNVDVIGVFWGAYKHMKTDTLKKSCAELISWHAAGRIHPQVCRTFPLHQAASAIDMLTSRRAIGKLVITNS